MNELEFLLIFFVIIFIPLFLVMILTVVAYWKLFVKAGEEGWKSLIPVYSTYIAIKLGFGEDKIWLIAGVFVGLFGGLLGESSLGVFLSLISIGFNMYISYGFMRRFTDEGMALASLFIPFIIYPIAAFNSKYQYRPIE